MTYPSAPALHILPEAGRKKEENPPPGSRCGSVETCRRGGPAPAGREGTAAEALFPEPDTMAEVILKNIKKVYPHQEPAKKKKGSEEKKTNLQITDEGVLAVQEFNLNIADKEFIVLVGPSGCGKSTTLRMVAGLEEISGGELYIDGKLMNDVAPKDRDIAMVFQNYALYPHMTVRENMAFPLKLKKYPKEEIRKRVDQAAEVLGITEYLDRKPKALSGGQRQRVAIGRAIVREPKVLLMDEPLSNLDAKLRNQMRAEIIKLRQRIDTTFIYVTHDQTEAMTLGDRIVIMKDGVIQQIGTPQEVFDHPTNLFVAGFIGTPQMNFFDAELVKENGCYAVVLENARVELSEAKQANLARKQVQPGPITLGVRPEHISLAGDVSQAVQGTVDVAEMMGSAVHLHVDACGRDTIVILQTMDLQGAGHPIPATGSALPFKRVSFLKVSTRSRPAARQWLRDRGSTGGDRPFGGGQAEPFSARRRSKKAAPGCRSFWQERFGRNPHFQHRPSRRRGRRAGVFPESEHLTQGEFIHPRILERRRVELSLRAAAPIKRDILWDVLFCGRNS